MNIKISDIIASKPFQRLKGKTQLYSPYNNDHYRNRLTHSLEVYAIALEIVEKFNDLPINTKLLSIISLCHDIGHTPYGHEGERTLNDILSGKDNLGGLIPDISIENMLAQGFKHNIYSAKLFLRSFEYNKGDSECAIVIDGIMKHTKPFYKDEGGNVIRLDYGVKNIIREFDSLNKINEYETQIEPISLEGKIVALADEIAQRCSDFTDTLISKLVQFSEIKKDICQFFGNNEDINYKNAERSIRETLINGVVYKDNCFSLEGNAKELNSKIEFIVKERIQKSYLIRSDDSKNCYMIRQVFKAYYQKPVQLDDSVIVNIYSDLIHNDVTQIKKYDNGNTIDLLSFCNFIKKSCDNLKQVDKSTKYDKLVFKYTLLNIAYYIASMTDSFLNKKYNKLYNGGTE